MQNVLSVIEYKIQNEIRYSLHFKQIVGTQIAKLDLTQQLFYEEIKFSGSNSSSASNDEQATSNSQPPSHLNNNQKNSDTQQTKEAILAALRRQQIPSNQTEYNEYVSEIRTGIEKKYENLIKNAHQYLSYMYLVSYNFLKCIHHSKKLLDFKTLAPSTAYNAHMYTAEAYCMLGRFQESMVHLEKAENQSEQNEAHLIVEKVELKFRNIRVS